MTEIKRMIKNEEEIEHLTVKRDIEIQIQDQLNKTDSTRYNEEYKKMRVTFLSIYLQSQDGQQSRINRFRFGSEIVTNKYWREEQLKIFTSCKEERFPNLSQNQEA